MYGRATEKARPFLQKLVEDPDKIQVLGHLKDKYDTDYFVIVAKWEGCSNPATNSGYEIIYLHSAVPRTGGAIKGAYWVSQHEIDIIEEYQSNKEASVLLSNEY